MTFPVIAVRGNDTSRAAHIAREVPRIPWDRFYSNVFKWRHGEHVALIGPTGQGKTTLLRQILKKHPFVCVYATKPRDDSMSALTRDGYEVITEWKSVDPKEMPRRILWPDAKRIDSNVIQQQVFRDAFTKIYIEGAWTVAIDELWYIINTLGLGHEVKTYLLQARALDISLVAATQRPFWVPTEIYDQSTHLFFWRDNDARNQKRLAEINVGKADLIASVIGNLESHQCLYINTRTGYMCRTRAPRIPEGR